MEEIEQELTNKSIERVKQVIVEPKPKKERSQAQKEAFEKARIKRAENLAKAKAEKEQVKSTLTSQDEFEGLEDSGDELAPEPPLQRQPQLQEQIIKPPPKKRGRPRKKKEEPPAPHFVPPTQGMPQNFYPVQGQQQQSFMYPPWMYQQPQQKEVQPVVNNYYYGTAPSSNNKETTIEKIVKPPTPPPPPQVESSEDEYEYAPDPRLKFRFA